MRISFGPKGEEMSVLTEQAHVLVDEFAKLLKLAGGTIILGSVIVAWTAIADWTDDEGLFSVILAAEGAAPAAP